MSEIKKILLKEEFEYYHNLLSAYYLNLIEEYKAKRMGITYHDDTRILEFGNSSTASESLYFIDNGVGNVTMYLTTSMSISDDGIGNISVTGATITDDNNGNVTIS